MKIPNLPNGWNPTYISETKGGELMLVVVLDYFIVEFFWNGSSESYQHANVLMRRKDFEEDFRKELEK